MDKIPAELLTQIIEELDEDPSPFPSSSSALDKDPLLANLRNVRLVCRGCKAAASKIFGQSFFSFREVVFEQKSLATLLNIARNKELRAHFVLLSINTYQFSQELTEWPNFKEEVQNIRTASHASFLNTEDANGKPPFRGAGILMAHASYRQFYKTQQRMNACGAFTAQLTEALMLLKKGNKFRGLSINGQTSSPALRNITKKTGMDSIHAESSGLINKVVRSIMQALYWSRVTLCVFNLAWCGIEHVILQKRYFVSKIKRQTPLNKHID
jgi:hypothetical protein